MQYACSSPTCVMIPNTMTFDPTASFASCFHSACSINRDLCLKLGFSGLIDPSLSCFGHRGAHHTIRKRLRSPPSRHVGTRHHLCIRTSIISPEISEAHAPDIERGDTARKERKGHGKNGKKGTLSSHERVRPRVVTTVEKTDGNPSSNVS